MKSPPLLKPKQMETTIRKNLVLSWKKKIVLLIIDVIINITISDVVGCLVTQAFNALYV